MKRRWTGKICGILFLGAAILAGWPTVEASAAETTPLYTPKVESSDTAKGNIDSMSFVRNDGGDRKYSIWKITCEPANSWLKLDYIQYHPDSAPANIGHKADSSDGTTAYITADTYNEDYVCKAYFTSAIAPLYEETDQDRITVTVDLSKDGEPVLTREEVSIPWFDLTPYGLSSYNRCRTEYGWGAYSSEELVKRPTVLHALIYLTERYKLGLAASECGKGTVDLKDVLSVSGDATELKVDSFWDSKGTVSFLRNQKCQLMEFDKVAAADYVLLKDGDALDIALSTEEDTSSKAGFLLFPKESYLLSAGEKLTVPMSRMEYGIEENETTMDADAVQVSVYDDAKKKIGDMTAEDGAWSYTFADAGIYYLIGKHAQTSAKACGDAPAAAKVTVTEGGAFQIDSASKMMEFWTYVNKLGNYGAKAVLTADVDMTALRWKGLGEATAAKAFSGELDGQGHVLTVGFTDVSLVRALSGTVKNLTIKGTSTASSTVADEVLYGATVENCTNYASVTPTAGSTSTAGGVVGTITSYKDSVITKDSSITIKNCTNYGNVDGTGTVYPARVGGVVASVNANIPAYSSKCGQLAHITGCVNHGNIKVADATYVGGVIGLCAASGSDVSDTDVQSIELSDCANHGQITAAEATYVGGIVSADIYNESDGFMMSRCINTGDITGSGISYAGGILPMIEGYKSTVEECANTGNIICEDGWKGGIAAISSGNILNCYNTGNITNNNLSKQRQTGGIVGIQRLYQLPNTFDYRGGKIQNCYSTGKVDAGQCGGALIGALDTAADDIEKYGTVRAGKIKAYALEGTAEKLIVEAGNYVANNNIDNTSFSTEEELKADVMVLTLGNAYKKDSENINGGYPVLAWQDGSSVEPVTVPLGDVNADDSIDMSDVLLVLRAVKGNIELSDLQKKAADVNGDGDITMSDTYLVFRYVRGHITAFPAEKK